MMRLRFSLAAVALIFAACSDGTASSHPEGVRFTQQPSNIKAGEPLQVTVELLGADGDKTDANASVTLSTASGASLTGTATVRASHGVAMFTDISVTQAGADVQLKATAGNASGLSQSFTVSPGAVAAAQSSVTPPGGALSAFAPTQLLFTFRDQFNNALSGVPVSVTSSIAGSAFTPPSGNATAAGTFTTTFTPAAEGNATLSATVDGAAITLGAAFTVTDVCNGAPFSFPGTISGTIPMGNCVINGFPTASHRFTLANEYVGQFTVNTAFAPLFQISGNPPGDNVVLRSDNPQIRTEWLLPAGSYNARVGSTAGSGTYSLVGLVVPNDEGCTLRYLAVAGTYTTQQILPDDCPTDQYFDPPDGSLADFYAIQSFRPCTITMRSAAMNSFLLAADWDTFDYFDFDDNSGGGVNGEDATLSLLTCTSATGPLVIVANHHVAAHGPYTLTITFGNPATSFLHAAVRPLHAPAIPPNLAAQLKRTSARRLIKR